MEEEESEGQRQGTQGQSQVGAGWLLSICLPHLQPNGGIGWDRRGVMPNHQQLMSEVWWPQPVSASVQGRGHRLIKPKP